MRIKTRAYGLIFAPYKIHLSPLDTQGDSLIESRQSRGAE